MGPSSIPRARVLTGTRVGTGVGRRMQTGAARRDPITAITRRGQAVGRLPPEVSAARTVEAAVTRECVAMELMRPMPCVLDRPPPGVPWTAGKGAGTAGGALHR